MQVVLTDTPLDKQPIEYNEKELLAARQDNANQFLQSEIKAGKGKLILMMLKVYKNSPSIESFLDLFPREQSIARAIVDLSETVYVD